MLIRRQVVRDCIFGCQIGTATQAQISMYVWILNWPLPIGAFQGQWNKLNKLRISTGRGRPVSYVQAQPRSWTRRYLEQIQPVVRVGLEFYGLWHKIQINHGSRIRMVYTGKILISVLLCGPVLTQFFCRVNGSFETWRPNSTIDDTL